MRVINFIKERKKPFLAALAAALCAVSFALFQEAARQERLAGRAAGQAVTLSITAYQLESLAYRGGFDFQDGFFETALANAAAYMGSRPATFAAVYRGDLTSLAAVQPHEARYFAPFYYPEFSQAALALQEGQMRIRWEGSPRINMIVNWRWVFWGTESPLLIVTAVSKHSLYAPSLGFTVGAVFSAFFALFLFLCGSIAYFVYDMHKTYRRVKQR